MNQVGAWICKKPVVSFYVITFAVSWGLGFSTVAVLKNEQFLLMPLAVLAFCAPALAGIIVTAVEGGQARPAFGRNRRRWIVFIVAMFAGTAIWLAHNHFLNSASITPVIAVFGFFFLTPPVAFIISAAFSRGTAVRGMMASLLRLRGVGGWVVLALVFIPALFIISVAASDLIERRPVLAASDAVLGAPLLGMIVLKFLYQMFFFNATGEESGWSGFARPRLQAHVSPLLTALIVVLFWVPWHFFYWYAEGRDVFTSAFWLEFYTAHLLASVIITWLYNRSRGSILVAGVAHAAGNTVQTFIPNYDARVALVVFAIAALLLVLIDKMWKRLPQEDPAVGHAPRLAV